MNVFIHELRDRIEKNGWSLQLKFVRNDFRTITTKEDIQMAWFL